jgi:hypothetical protein
LEWTNDEAIVSFLRTFPDVILAIADTRCSERGFICRYWDGQRDITDVGDGTVILPTDRTVIKIATTGNHFLSVISHPELQNGVLLRINEMVRPAL